MFRCEAGGWRVVWLYWWFNGVFLCTAVAGKVLKGELAVVSLLLEV